MVVALLLYPVFIRYIADSVKNQEYENHIDHKIAVTLKRKKFVPLQHCAQNNLPGENEMLSYDQIEGKPSIIIANLPNAYANKLVILQD